MRLKAAFLEADIVIVGAGVAGLSTAYHLAKNSKKSILVLEQETKLGGHASGRNAGMIRQTVSDPYLARLAADGRRSLAKASRGGWKKIRFTSNGSILLAGRDKASEIKKIEAVTHALGVSTRRLSAEEACAKVPYLRGADFTHALFCPGDALVENKPLVESFYREARRLGVRVLLGAGPSDLRKENGRFVIRVGSLTVYADQLVNAAGAWCGLLAEKMGAQKIPLRSYRRHLYLTGPVKTVHRAWPFVWDLSREIYFRPEGRGLLVSPCDKEAMDRRFLDRRQEITDRRVRGIVAKKMRSFSEPMGRLGIRAEKSGLRTMAPDGRFVIGEDRQLPSFFWVAGLGGHGVTTCFSVGKLSSDIILGRKIDAGLQKAFSPRRFKGR